MEDELEQSVRYEVLIKVSQEDITFIFRASFHLRKHAAVPYDGVVVEEGWVLKDT
jgi:hypothetical protein